MPRVLVGAAVVTFSLKGVLASSLPPPSRRPDHVSSRSEAHWHVSADAHPSCVLPAIVWLLARAQLDECRVPRLAAPIGPSPSHQGGCLASDGRLGGGEARRFEAGYAVCVPRLAAQRRFAACAEDAERVIPRRRATFPGHWEPYLHVFHTPSWSHVER